MLELRALACMGAQWAGHGCCTRARSFAPLTLPRPASASPSQKTRIQVWLFENTDLRIEGKIIGFDEYMNLVLDEAEELSIKKKTRKALGRILLKGDNITLMMSAQQS